MSRERLTHDKEGLLVYRYQTCAEIGFVFHTLAEVGAPYQPWFRDEIARRGWYVVHGVELERAPWVADVLVGIRPDSANP